MAGRGSNDNGSGTGRAPGQEHFPLPTDRAQRLKVLADLFRRGLYVPDYEKLANALIDKEPDLFRLDNQPDSLAADATEERDRQGGAKVSDKGCGKDCVRNGGKETTQDVPSRGKSSGNTRR